MEVEYKENVLTAEDYILIESKMGDALTSYVKETSIAGTSVSLCLMSAKGKEGFYEKLGFLKRPHNWEGAGMELEIDII